MYRGLVTLPVQKMLNSNSGATLFPEIEWCQTFHATPNQRSYAVGNVLRLGAPVKDIPHIHIRRDPAKPRNAAHKTVKHIIVASAVGGGSQTIENRRHPRKCRRRQAYCGPRLPDYSLCGPQGQKGWTALA